MHQNIALMESDHIKVFEKARKNNFFNSRKFERYCFANLYLILAGSWWVNGNNKLRGLFFVFKSFVTFPPLVIRKIWEKI